MNQKTLKLILSEMKNLLILILAIAIASCGNSKKNKESESKKMNIAAAGLLSPYHFTTWLSRPIKRKRVTPWLTGVLVVVVESEAWKTRLLISRIGCLPVWHGDARDALHNGTHPDLYGSRGHGLQFTGSERIKLSGEVVADIYLGKITKWNDAKIQELNPSVTLPNKELTPVYRSDGSIPPSFSVITWRK